MVEAACGGASRRHEAPPVALGSTGGGPGQRPVESVTEVTSRSIRQGEEKVPEMFRPLVPNRSEEKFGKVPSLTVEMKIM